MFRSLFVKLFVAVLAFAPVLGAAMAHGHPRTPLSEAELAAFRGGNPIAGKCANDCSAYQALVGEPGVWSCIGKMDGAACDRCEPGLVIHHLGQSSALCPGYNYKTGTAKQDCGLKVRFAACKEEIDLPRRVRSTAA